MYLQAHPKIACSRESFQELTQFIDSSIPFLDMIIDHAHLEADSIKVLKLIFPNWFSAGHEIELTQCKDGITNKLMKCTNKNSGHVVLIRAYGKKSDLIIDRPQELVNFVTLSFKDLAPPIFGRFKNGFVYGYIEGKPLSKQEMAVPEVAKLIGKTVAMWHRMEVPGEPSPRLFRTLKKWFDGLPKQYDNDTVQSMWSTSGITHAWIQEQLLALEHLITAYLDSPVVFCHNDLLSANIIYSGQSVSFIDYEYGAQNYRGFDIGNHFCEYAGFECEFDQYYPDKQMQMTFLRSYLKALKGDNQEPTELELEHLYLEVNVFALTSHFFWGLWALLQASFSDIQFDYMGYAIRRFKRYNETKQHWFNLLEHNS